MKILTANFVTCAVKACKVSPLAFPLHFQDAELEQQDMEYSAVFLRNILPRIEWDALRITAAELGFTTLPEQKPEVNTAHTGGAGGEEDGGGAEQKHAEDGEEEEAADEGTGKAAMEGVESAEQAEQAGAQEALLRELHRLLVETQVVEGRMVCGNCGHEYRIKEGIANFLLPNHLV